MHRGTQCRQVVTDCAQYVYRRLVEREKLLERLASDGVGPGKALAVILEIRLDKVGLRNRADSGQDDVVEVRLVLQQSDVLQSVVGDDIFDAHLRFQGLLR